MIVLFGATGDLAKRKLLPGLAYLDDSELAPDVRVVGTSLEDLTTEQFRALARSPVAPNSTITCGASVSTSRRNGREPGAG